MAVRRRNSPRPQPPVPGSGIRSADRGRLLSRFKGCGWAAGILLLIVAVAYARKGIPSPPVVQPVAFNHKAHVDNGLGCDFCHQGLAAGSPLAGKPKTAVCRNCHNPDAPLVNSPAEKQLLGYLKESKDPPWALVHRLPDYAYFSHFRHVTLGKLECKVCHGDVAERTTPMPRLISPLTMDWCRRCHAEKKATLDCNACHR